MDVSAMLKPGVCLCESEADIHTVLAESDRVHHYDKLAAGYDLLVGNSLYNRLLWGNWAADYRAYCHQALADSSDGPFLDAGCGTLVFTAEAYAGTGKDVVLMDRSLGMLRRARQRLRRLCGEVPRHIMLLQGDIFHLPFLADQFQTVASFGVMHLFEDVESLVQELRRVKHADGRLWLSSLVRETGLGRLYYDLLQGNGEIAVRRDAEALLALLSDTGRDLQARQQGNMLYLSLR